MPASYCQHAVDPEGLSLGVHGIQKVTRDLHSPVYALVELVGLGMVECESYIRPSKNSYHHGRGAGAS